MKRYTILKSEIYEKGGGSAMSAARPYPKNSEVAPPGARHDDDRSDK